MLLKLEAEGTSTKAIHPSTYTITLTARSQFGYKTTLLINQFSIAHWCRTKWCIIPITDIVLLQQTMPIDFNDNKHPSQPAAQIFSDRQDNLQQFMYLAGLQTAHTFQTKHNTLVHAKETETIDAAIKKLYLHQEYVLQETDRKNLFAQSQDSLLATATNTKCTWLQDTKDTIQSLTLEMRIPTSTTYSSIISKVQPRLQVSHRIPLLTLRWIYLGRL